MPPALTVFGLGSGLWLVVLVTCMRAYDMAMVHNSSVGHAAGGFHSGGLLAGMIMLPSHTSSTQVKIIR